MDTQFISIDIHVNKLLEWLISRRHCNADWPKEAVKVRAKINAAIQDMPENKIITQLLSGTYINYFHCLEIIEILQETEADTKNIFGHYSSKRMKDWKEVVSMYTKNKLYLAEAADLLTNTVRYEIPSIKKQITKAQQAQTDYKKKEKDAIKSQQSSQNELNSLLKELDLQSVTSGFRSNLIEKAKELNNTHDEIVKESVEILPAIERYSAFCAHSQPNYKPNMNVIEYLATKGNTTTYEFVKGIPPEVVNLPPMMTSDEGSDTNDDGIDWGFEEDASGIEIEVVDSGDLETSDIKSQDKGQVRLAEGENALSVLDNPHCRTNFINQLLELQTFYKARLFEGESEDGMGSTLEESPAVLSSMLLCIEKVLTKMTNQSVQHKYNIMYSPRYLDDILKKIEQKQNAIERAGAIAVMCVERAQEAEIQASTLRTKSQVIITKCQELESQVVDEISKLYPGRQVYLIGGA